MVIGSTPAKDCLLCANLASLTYEATWNWYRVDCCVCGPYILTESANVVLDRDASNERRHALAWVVRGRPNCNEPIKPGDLDELVSSALLREPTPSGKVRLILQTLKNRSYGFGHSVPFDIKREWPQIKARGADECQALLAVMREQGLAPPRHNQDANLVLTWKAWEPLEPLRGSSDARVFVAMAFRPDVTSIYDRVIVPAIERCHLVPVRIDREKFEKKICEQILIEIHAAQFVIADFTHHRGGVYFEAGYALALGKPVIWSCRQDEFNDVHFDTRQYPHIVWNSEEELGAEIQARLNALLARPH